jgi:DNA repair exonuclease SbcCD nuclease subunit
MLRVLLLGDPHIVPQELDDAKALEDLVFQTIDKHKLTTICILGDLHNNHSVLSSVVINYWKQFIARLQLAGVKHIVCLIGNHDFYSPTIMSPHGLLSYIDPLINNYDHQFPQVVDAPQWIMDGVSAMPYEPDPAQFVAHVKQLKEKWPQNEILLCHQTFDGAKFHEGFYAKDAVDASLVPFKYIISGHVHTPHAFGNVWYPGAPRWRTLSDANQDRYICVVEMSAQGFGIVDKVPTWPTCRRIIKFIDQEGQHTDIPQDLQNTDVRVDIYGSQEYYKQQSMIYKAKCNARCRPFFTKKQSNRLTEADGIGASFQKFSKEFHPPKGTNITILTQEVESRLWNTPRRGYCLL